MAALTQHLLHLSQAVAAHYHLFQVPLLISGIFSSHWFAEALRGNVAEPPVGVEGRLRVLALPDSNEPACMVDGWSVAEIACALLNLMGVRLRGAPYPLKTDPVATLRLMRIIPAEQSARAEVARRIREECDRFGQLGTSD